MGANRKKPADDRSGRLQCEFDLRAEKQLAVNPVSFGAQVVSGSNIASLSRKPSVTPGALRSSAYRQQKAKHDGVTVPDVTHVAAPATSTVTYRDSISVVVLIAALGVAGVSAGFSIYGLTRVFSGMFLPILAMGASLEVAKFAAIAWLGRRQVEPLLKAVMVALVATLMMLSATGSFGFLTAAHVSGRTAHRILIDDREADIEARRRLKSRKGCRCRHAASSAGCGRRGDN
jgi:hypothetical protein